MRPIVRLSLLSVQSFLLLSACLLLEYGSVLFISAFSPALGHQHNTFLHQLIGRQQRRPQQKSPPSSRVVLLGSISGEEINKRLEAQLTKLRAKDRLSKPLRPEVRLVDF